MDKPPISPLLVKASDAASMLGMSRTTFYTQVALGRVMEPLRYGKLRLWSTEALANMIRDEVAKQRKGVG